MHSMKSLVLRLMHELIPLLQDVKEEANVCNLGDSCRANHQHVLLADIQLRHKQERSSFAVCLFCVED